MKVFYGLEHIEKIPNAVVTSGTFDGVHIGHQKILQRISETAKKDNGYSVLITFWPHPRLVLDQNNSQLKLLSTIDEKIELLRSFGLDYLVVIPFTKAFSKLSSFQFVNDILVKTIGTKKLIIGYDHHFGRNREGSFEYLNENAEKFGFTVEEISRQDIDDIGISSTKIRNSLLNHNISVANDFLGRPYEIRGKVVHGDSRGKEMGFPTANVEIKEDYKLIPCDSVYAVEVEFYGSEFYGMLNIGMRPTVDGKKKQMEVHIFDFNQEIYGETLIVRFLDFIRIEKKFSDIQELKIQLDTDMKTVKERIKKINKT
ncbi:bifunctional riboflavin kinase/FAD synthetase [Hyphobacterium sp. CCMP332]|nr:bifunctional riboflavin kinase/FAD synthetase [Hyphobacterium sp. CCMP332]